MVFDRYVFSGVLDVERLQLEDLVVQVQDLLLQLLSHLDELLVIHSLLRVV